MALTHTIPIFKEGNYFPYMVNNLHPQCPYPYIMPKNEHQIKFKKYFRAKNISFTSNLPANDETVIRIVVTFLGETKFYNILIEVMNSNHWLNDLGWLYGHMPLVDSRETQQVSKQAESAG